MRILKDAYDEAKGLLSDNRDAIDKIADFLIEKETITGKEFMEIFRRVKGIPDPAEDERRRSALPRRRTRRLPGLLSLPMGRRKPFLWPMEA